MSSGMNYTLTRDTITVVVQGKSYVVRKGVTNFAKLRDAIMREAWEEVPGYLTISRSIEAWARDKFSVEGEVISYNGKPLPPELNQRIFAMVAEGKSPEPFFKFWERLEQNPSYRSVHSLWPFLQHLGIPLTEDGCFIAYKGVNRDYTDRYSGKITYQPGTMVRYPRNEVSDDPRTPCHEGLHVG